MSLVFNANNVLNIEVSQSLKLINKLRQNNHFNLNMIFLHDFKKNNLCSIDSLMKLQHSFSDSNLIRNISIDDETIIENLPNDYAIRNR